MRRTCALLIALIGLALTPASAETIGGPRTFSFVALGDVPYLVADEDPKVPKDNDDYVKFGRLIAAINALKPAFSIHVGDIKKSSSACTDARFKKVYDLFQTFDQPLVYTPGDNEWTDCHNYKLKPGEPEELRDPRVRLARLRQMFFPNPDRSLGKSPMEVESQAKVMTGFATYVENVRFVRNDVLFVTVHIPGSNNGLEATTPAAAEEFFARNRANIAWINDSFAMAGRINAKAVVLAFQANPYNTRYGDSSYVPLGSGFRGTLEAIDRGAQAFNKPVLVVQGDNHVLEVSGMRDADAKRWLPKVMRLQVMGEPFVHAVRVIVDPDSPGVFGFVPLIVPENGPF